MIKNLKKLFTVTAMAATLTLSCYSQVNGFGIVLDPGHGGDRDGCKYTYDGKEVKEKDINLKISKLIREEFKKYITRDGKEIEVYLTREGEECPTLSERVKMGISKNADIVVSLHNNACDDHTNKGSMILVTSSNFNKFYELEENLSLNILKELQKLSISPAHDTPTDKIKMVLFNKGTSEKSAQYRPEFELKNGLLRRLSGDGTTYDNGDITDWYGIIRNGIANRIPSILVEHAHLDNEEDYRNFLSTDEKLQALAKADVAGIVKYYGLQLKY